MTWGHPERLLWLVAVAPLALALIVAERRRARAWRRLGVPARLPSSGALAWLAAIAIGLVALAQPRWGRSIGGEPSPGHDVVLLVDVSRSMGATDSVPSRLGAAVRMAKGLIDTLAATPDERVGLVVFAGRGVVRAPLTESLGAVADALDRVRPGAVRPGGTNLAAAIDAALALFPENERAEGRTIVLFSDGEDLAGTWRQALDRLAQSRVTLHAIALGDATTGSPIPAGVDEVGQPRFVREGGSMVVSRRNDEPLEALASAGSGAFVPAGTLDVDLGTLYRTRVVPQQRALRVSRSQNRGPERFPLVLAAALAVGLLGSWPRWTSRPATIGWAAPVLILMSSCTPSDSPAALVARGNQAMEAGDPARALSLYQRTTELDASSPIPHTNAALALARLGRPAEALSEVEVAQKLAGSPDIRLDYIEGNLRFATGDYAASLAAYDRCLAAPSTLDVNLQLIQQDAAHNRAIAAARLASRTEPQEAPESSASRPGQKPNQEPTGEVSTASPGTARAEASSARAGGGGGTAAQPSSNFTPQHRLQRAVETITARRAQPWDISPTNSSPSEARDW